MQIANPIYDVVFKYLMEDSKIAKMLISSIIKQEIEILDFRPQEFTTQIEKKKILRKKRKKKKQIIDNEPTFFTVYRLDFSAKIKTPEGDKMVFIEIQKAKFASDIMRFRKYLGSQYGNKENYYIVEKDGRRYKRACEIISIYFLGHELDNIHGVPVIKSEKKYIDVSTGKEINKKEYFIDSLNHESYTIPIPELKEKRRNELEKLLSIFDQSNRTEDHHILNVKEEDFPEEFRDFIRRLQKAANEPEIRRIMDIEDEIIEEIREFEREKERELAIKDVIIDAQIKTIDEKEKAIEEKEKTIEEKEKMIEIKDKAIEEKEKTIEIKDKAIEEKEKTIEENEKTIEENEKTIEENEKTIEIKDKAIEEKEKTIEEKEKTIDDLKNELEELRKKLK